MTAYADSLRPFVGNPNVQAFLHLIREGESSQDDRAFFMRWGGIGNPPAYFDDLTKHPRILEPGPNGPSSAAGAFQITMTTYDDFAPRLGVTDFSRQTQELIAVAIIHNEGALNDVLEGRIADAIDKLGGRWASFPSSTAGQPTAKLERLLRVYAAFGGSESREPTATATLSAEAPPSPAPAPAPTSTKEASMIPAIPAFVLTAAELLLPFVVDLFRGHGGKTATRNADIVQKAGPAMVEIAKAVTGAQNEQQAAEMVRDNPSIQGAFRKAVEADLDRLVGVIERISAIDEASADRAAERAKADDAINAATKLLIYGALGGAATVFVSLIALLILQTIYMPDHRPMGELVALFITTCGTIVGFAVAIYLYRFGSSAGSKASGDAIRSIAEGKR